MVWLGHGFVGGFIFVVLWLVGVGGGWGGGLGGGNLMGAPQFYATGSGNRQKYIEETTR